MNFGRQIAILLATGLATVALAIARPAAAQLSPLPDAWRAALAKVGTDPPPKALAADAHFVRSDESAHFVAYGHLKDLGGVLLGVGTDPNYLMAGWMKAELVLLVDFDQVVADVHTLYILALRHAETADAFVQLWSAKGAPKFAELVAAMPDAAARRRAQAALKLARHVIWDRLVTLRKDYKAQKVPMAFTDADQYAHVRDLALKDRIWAWRGDLTGAATMTGIQGALKALGREVSAFYITNAEAYFDYTAQARKNLRDLPYGEKSIVLRTQGVPSKATETADGHYRYMVQNGRDFAAWMALKRTTSAKTICWSRKPTKVQGFFTIPGPPPPKAGKSK
ncbi:MAG: hypothetical protein FJ100_04575 [Deltaproteobacteria bacterium]|nr:hypothetical protein [Deltaproteobacteria bacterium]